ncbi:MAG: glycosyltransferase, partial [Gemmatimonadaceae bacterium]
MRRPPASDAAPGAGVDTGPARGRITALVLVHESVRHLRACLRALLASDGVTVDVVVIDNGSSAAALAEVRAIVAASGAAVTLLELPENVGYAGGNAVGIARACAEGASWVLVVNDDVAVDPDAVASLYEASRLEAALVLDANGVAVPNATVTWTAPASGASAILSGGTSTTNAGGVATLTATANATAGAYVVTASTAGLSATFSLANVGAPASLRYLSGGTAADPSSTTVNATFAAPLSLQVLDAAGRPVSGAVVTFSAPATGPSGTPSSVTATSDTSGEVSVTMTANGTQSPSNTPWTATATVSGLTLGFSLINLAPGPASLFVVSGSGQVAPVSTLFGNPLVLAVTAAVGNPQANTSVTYT